MTLLPFPNSVTIKMSQYPIFTVPDENRWHSITILAGIGENYFVLWNGFMSTYGWDLIEIGEGDLVE